ncbi:SpvB/TcaC N-terminal domain-containing protein [Sorangium sp. KYC3313]|uniref:SpvB/TcaC N-terminal domain-containing protein n=1 Tax=Sorangium sp. KYC3313 TaxID=3449740 RepID=UPI003F89F70E
MKKRERSSDGRKGQPDTTSTNRAQATPDQGAEARAARQDGGSGDGKGREPGGQPLLPALTLPKGGGAIRGIGEKFSVNPATGTSSLAVPLPASPGRGGFGPQLQLAYDSGGGNGAFGLGFALSIASISRKTDKGLPRYRDDIESDDYILSGAEDLVPTLSQTGAPELDRGTHVARTYRPRVEGLFARIERWIRKDDGDVHWRVTTKDNTTHVYGQTPEARIADPRGPEVGRDARIFRWLLEESRDDTGNIIRYEYKAEDGGGVDPSDLSEKSRFKRQGGNVVFLATAQRYLKRVRYCNAAPFVASDFMMEMVFDYGEHAPAETTTTAVPTPADTGPGTSPWTVRQDPFSSYRATFEVRTYRLCRRVLMFHCFPANGTPVLVRSTDFEYDANGAFTYLVGVTQAGYLFDTVASTWQRQVLPTLRLDYVRPVINDTLSALPRDSLVGIEGGMDGAAKQWIDLNGEGIPGVLIDEGSTWYYKANRGQGKLEAPRTLSALPAPSTLVGGIQQLEDLGGDGQLDLVAYGAPLSGYFSSTPEGGFEALRTFESLPNIDWMDPNLRFIDLDGDGLADLLITEDHAFVWYRSKAKQGFGEAQRVSYTDDDERGPAVVFADPEQSIQLADMSGDGLVDIVRVRNGEVSYWPNLGYGRFGKKVTLENGPVFAAMDEFDARRIRFGDVDGSGTSDILYLGSDSVALYLNESGNRLAAPVHIHSLPPVDNAVRLGIVDLLGQGTACLVWSSPLPTARSIFYVDLMAGAKPHLLRSVVNNLGVETTISYAPSTKFYLEDKAAGIQWLTRLPFPVHVVDHVERVDAISKSRFVTTYRYRHGFFDGVEREFRGFARVEQRDAEEFTVGASGTELFQAPVRMVSWYHTGAWLEKERLERELAEEYFQKGPAALLLRDTVLPQGMSIQDEREAARALRGRLLRQEVYALDGTDKENIPYVTTEQSFGVRRIKTSEGTRHGVFMVHDRERVLIHSERKADDPRVVHDLVIDVDDFGNVKRRVSLAYARATGEPEQRRAWATVSEADFINKPAEDTWYRVGLRCEERHFELTGLTLPAAGQGLLARSALHDDQGTGVLDMLDPEDDLPYEGESTGLAPQRRLIQRTQQVFYKDDLTGPLPLGEVESLALPYKHYELALTPGLVSEIVQDSGQFSATAFDPAVLLSEGRYVQRDGGYWTASGHLIFDPARFYLPVEAVDSFGEHSFVTYDDFALLIETTTDPLNNQVQAENDYRVLAPWHVTDPNLNRSAVAFDALGEVVRSAVMGKDSANEGDTLDNPTSRVEYDILRWQVEQKPAFVHTFTREVHHAGSPTTPFHESLAYCDGFGRVVMQKVQAEPGDAPLRDGQGVLVRDGNGALVIGPVTARWIGTGRTVFNNKGNPVKQFEPFFSSTAEYEDESDLVEWGVTPIVHYDPLDRVIRTEFPDGAESRAEFDAWLTRTFDQNDAVIGTPWLAERQSGSASAAEQRAATLALEHADTPSATYLDALGRAFWTVIPNRIHGVAAPSHETRRKLDVQGHVLRVIDARGVEAVTEHFDVLGRRFSTASPDGGAHLDVVDIGNKLVRSYNGRRQNRRHTYDALQRLTRTWLFLDGEPERLVRRVVYGEAHPEALQRNLRGRAFQVYDGAGVVTSQTYDFKGNLLQASRRLRSEVHAGADWSVLSALTDVSAIAAAADPLLEAESFEMQTEYDALNRPTSQIAPDASEIKPTYNEAGLLERIEVWIPGAATWTTFVDNIDYDAKGQRERIDYGNGTSTEYTYDPLTCRLARLRTTRSSDGAVLQNLTYTYDPVGNIVEIKDSAQQTVFFNNAVVSPNAQYAYDAVYRLIEATGREHAGGLADVQRDQNDLPIQALPHPNNPQALRNYTEEYFYDAVGNLVRMEHLAGAGTWIRRYAYEMTSNRLVSTFGDPEDEPSSPMYTHDAHGNMTAMPHIQALTWDENDQLRSTDLDGGGVVYYAYDAAGQRVRKVWEHNGLVEERIYIGGYEVYRKRDATGLVLERQTLHVMDSARRVAMVETKTVDTSGPFTVTPRVRYQLDNHLGSASLEVDGAGLVIGYEEYHPYGTTAYWAAASGIEVSQRRYRYTGKEKDEETGLYYHGARYYAPWLGRWTSADPAGMVDGPGLYNYVMGNPVRLHDPSGNEGEEFGTWEQAKLLAWAMYASTPGIRKTEKAVKESLIGTSTAVTEAIDAVVYINPIAIAQSFYSDVKTEGFYQATRDRNPAVVMQRHFQQANKLEAAGDTQGAATERARALLPFAMVLRAAAGGGAITPGLRLTAPGAAVAVAEVGGGAVGVAPTGAALLALTTGSGGKGGDGKKPPEPPEAAPARQPEAGSTGAKGGTAAAGKRPSPKFGDASPIPPAQAVAKQESLLLERARQQGVRIGLRIKQKGGRIVEAVAQVNKLGLPRDEAVIAIRAALYSLPTKSMATELVQIGDHVVLPPLRLLGERRVVVVGPTGTISIQMVIISRIEKQFMFTGLNLSK